MNVSHDHLHAYVDGALSEDERRAVDDYLAQRPEEAARVRAWRAQNAGLHELFDPVLSEPHSLTVTPTAKSLAHGAWSTPQWVALAATLLLGVSLGFIARGAYVPLALRMRVPIAQQAALAHAAYVPEVRHPVEVGASEEQHLVAWLSKRLAASLRAPDLNSAGFHLLGGRLLPAAGEVGDAPVALLMYENAQGRRLSLLVRHEASSRETAFQFSQRGATGVFYWIDGSLGYALAGDVDHEELASLAQLVYRQLNP